MTDYLLSVLICDDSMLIRKKLRAALEAIAPMEITETTDGAKAVEACQSHKQDLVFLDIVMPHKDGLQALAEIKEMHPDTVVIMATSAGTKSNLSKALASGADGFIQKPVVADAVREVVDKFMLQKGGEQHV